MEGPGLGNKSRVKTLLERSEKSVTVACYPMNDQEIGQLIRSEFKASGIEARPDAVTWLVSQLGADRALTRRELEKLVLYVGDGGTLEIEDARVCVGDLSGLSLEDALFAATDGDVAGADRALELALSEGATPVGVVRAALMHVQRLLRAMVHVQAGMRPSAATKAARPPVHFRREAVFSRALDVWTMGGLQAASIRLWESERACKRTGAPAELLCRSAVMGLSQRALAARRRG
jgi:DNA polymerase-3 subunit delta